MVIPCLLFGTFFGCLSQLISCNFVTFIDKESMIETENNDIQNVTVNKTTVKMQHEVLSKEKGLLHVIEKISEVRDDAEISKSIKTSYVEEKTGNIIQEVFASSKEKIVPLSASSCSKEDKKDLDVPTSCKRYKAIYLDALKALMKDLFMWPLMVVNDEDPCARNFAKTLIKDLGGEYMKSLQKEHPSLYFHEIAGNSRMLNSVSLMLYKAATFPVRTIILLSSDELAKLIFEMAKTHKSVNSYVAWMTMESTIEGGSVPSFFLNLKVEGNVEKLIQKIDAKSLMMLNLKTAGLATNEGEPFIQSFQALEKREADNVETNNMSQIPCQVKNKEMPSVLISHWKEKYQWTPIYSWSTEKGINQLSIDKELSWLSRGKLHKPVLKVVSIMEQSFARKFHKFYDNETLSCSKGLLCKYSKKENNVTKWLFSCCIGYSIDLAKELQKDLWVAMDLYMVEDGFYGSIVGGVWNGMIGDLVNGKADVAIAPLTATSKRSAVVDFSESYVQSSLSIVVASLGDKELKFLNFNFATSIAMDLLIALAVAFILGFFLIFFLEKGFLLLKARNYRFRDAFTYLSGITFQRDLGGKNPKQISARITFVPFAFGMVVIMSTYTATLTAVKVTKENHVGLTGMDDKRITNPSNEFKFAVLKSSSIEEYFRFSEDPKMQNIYLFMKKYLVEKEDEAMKKVLNGELQAYITDHHQAQYYASRHKDCGLHIVKTNQGKNTWNLGLRRGSPWKSIISEKILAYKERGLFVDLHGKWMESKCTKENGISNTIDKFTVEYFGGLVVILGCAFAFCVLILLTEHFYYKKKRHFIKHSFDVTVSTKSAMEGKVVE